MCFKNFKKFLKQGFHNIISFHIAFYLNLISWIIKY